MRYFSDIYLIVPKTCYLSDIYLIAPEIIMSARNVFQGFWRRKSLNIFCILRIQATCPQLVHRHVASVNTFAPPPPLTIHVLSWYTATLQVSILLPPPLLPYMSSAGTPPRCKCQYFCPPPLLPYMSSAGTPPRCKCQYFCPPPPLPYMSSAGTPPRCKCQYFCPPPPLLPYMSSAGTPPRCKCQYFCPSPPLTIHVLSWYTATLQVSIHLPPPPSYHTCPQLVHRHVASVNTFAPPPPSYHTCPQLVHRHVASVNTFAPPPLTIHVLSWYTATLQVSILLPPPPLLPYMSSAGTPPRGKWQYFSECGPPLPGKPPPLPFLFLFGLWGFGTLFLICSYFMVSDEDIAMQSCKLFKSANCYRFLPCVGRAHLLPFPPCNSIYTETTNSSKLFVRQYKYSRRINWITK